MEYNKNIINTQSRRKAKEKHNNNDKWKNYAQRIQKHPYVKEYLMLKYKGIYQYCGFPIRKNLQLQHATYDKECVTEETIKIHHSTPKVPNGTRKVPDYEKCFKFEKCISEMYPVHSYCNCLISKETFRAKTIGG